MLGIANTMCRSKCNFRATIIPNWLHIIWGALVSRARNDGFRIVFLFGPVFGVFLEICDGITSQSLIYGDQAREDGGGRSVDETTVDLRR